MKSKEILGSINNILLNIGLKPLHPCTLAFYYLPMKGCAAYVMLSTQMLHPELYRNFNFVIVPRYISLTNACLFNSIIGSSLYLFSRRHVQSIEPKKRILYCLFASSTFNLGSLLLWALGKTSLPDCSVLKILVGLSGSTLMLWTARNYINIIDSQITSKEHH